MRKTEIFTAMAGELECTKQHAKEAYSSMCKIAKAALLNGDIFPISGVCILRGSIAKAGKCAGVDGKEYSFPKRMVIKHTTSKAFKKDALKGDI